MNKNVCQHRSKPTTGTPTHLAAAKVLGMTVALGSLASSKKMRRNIILILILLSVQGCDTSKEGFDSQIIRTDSLIIVKSDYTDTLYLSQFKYHNFLMEIADRYDIKKGEEFRSKMFFFSDSLFHPPYNNGNKEYQMYFKQGSIEDTTTQFKKIESLNDTAYVRFLVQDNGKDTTHKLWSGKIVIKLNERDSTFYLQSYYRIKD